MVLYEKNLKSKVFFCAISSNVLMSSSCFLKALTHKCIILIKNVSLEKGLVTGNIVNSLIKVLL